MVETNNIYTNAVVNSTNSATNTIRAENSKQATNERPLSKSSMNDAAIRFKEAQDLIASDKTDQGVSRLDSIINGYSTGSTSRPAKYDEAVLLKADLFRIQAQNESTKEGQFEKMRAAQELLESAFNKLLPYEEKYKARYSLELLVLANQYHRMFARDLYSPEKIQKLYEDTTIGFNKASSGFKDNFIALRAVFNYAELLTRKGELDKAGKLLDEGDILYRRFIGDKISPDEKKAVSKYFVGIGILGKVLPWEANKFFDTVTFDGWNYDRNSLDSMHAFISLRKGAYHLKMAIGKKDPKTNHIIEAKNAYLVTLKAMEKTKDNSKGDFFGSSMWEERQAYFMAKAGLLEVYKNQNQGKDASEIARYIVGYYNNGSITRSDFGLNNQQSEVLWKALVDKKYIDTDGIIQDSFMTEFVIKKSDPSKMGLGLSFIDDLLIKGIITNASNIRKHDIRIADANKIASNYLAFTGHRLP